MKQISFPMVSVLVTFLWCLVAGGVTAATPSDVTLSTEPATPIIEQTRTGQALNFDVLVKNPTGEPLELIEFVLTARDSQGQLVAQRRLGQNGNTIEVIPAREVPAEGRLLIFNPFSVWPTDAALESLDVTITLGRVGDGSTQVVRHSFKARKYSSKHVLTVPVDGAAFVHSGHDLLSHHRRFPLHSDMTDALKIRHNVTRYAYDLALVDDAGAMYRSEGKQLSDWFGYGAPVRAPASGIVVEAHDGQPENEIGKPPRLDRDAIMKNPQLLFGNYVLIDHGDGEISTLAHLKPGSLKVKPGQRVQKGEHVAAVGMSGDAAIVHLHYQMQTARGFAEGVPSRFEHFDRKTARGWAAATPGVLETGEIVRDTSRARQQQ